MSDALSYSASIDVNMYSNAGDVKPLQTYKGAVKKNKDNYYSSMLGKTIVINSNYGLMVDEKQKVIVIDAIKEKNKAQQEALKRESLLMIDTALTKNYRLKYLVNDTKTKIIELLFPEGSPYKKMEIEIDLTTYFIKKAVYYIEKDKNQDYSFEKISVAYSHVVLNAAPAADVFSEKKYVQIKGKDIKAASAYLAYKIIDQRKNKILLAK